MNEINREKAEDQESMYWKQKYEEQRQINQALEDRIKIKITHRASFSTHRTPPAASSLDQKE